MWSNSENRKLALGAAAALTVVAGVAYTLGARQATSKRSRRQSLSVPGGHRGSHVGSETAFVDEAMLRSQTLACFRTPDNHVYKIAITGGPCSGKSTCMSHVREKLTELGFAVFVVPEVATLLINGGLTFDNMTEEKVLQIQTVILQTILRLEDSFTELASVCGTNAVVLCDRGTMDGRAYCTEEQWQEILRRSGMDMEELRNTRYDAVVHLVTAAIGAEKFYTTANNAARRETVEEARALDEATRSKWIGHHQFKVVDNSTEFADKVNRVLSTITNVVGKGDVTASIKIFTVKDFDPAVFKKHNVEFVSAKVRRTVLRAHNDERFRLIRRDEGGNSSFFLQTRKVGDLILHKDIRLSGREYSRHLALRDDEHEEVERVNYAFVYHHEYVQVKVVVSPARDAGLTTFHVAETCTVFPPFLTIDRDVTDDPQFQAYK